VVASTSCHKNLDHFILHKEIAQRFDRGVQDV